MTLTKAEEILTLWKLQRPASFDPDFITALNLGIESLHREQRNRQYPMMPTLGPLPGETFD